MYAIRSYYERESTGVKMVLKVLRQIPDVNDESIAAFDRFLQEYEMIAGARIVLLGGTG